LSCYQLSHLVSEMVLEWNEFMKFSLTKGLLVRLPQGSEQRIGASNGIVSLTTRCIEVYVYGWKLRYLRFETSVVSTQRC
jgi:hypothetical protein